MSAAIGRVAASGRTPASGRTAASGRATSLTRQGYLFTFGSTLLRAYWRTDQQTVTVVSGKVSQWNDQSGNGRHLLQGSSTRRPTWTAQSSSIPSRSAITFSGSQFLQGAFNAMSSATSWTMCVVAKSTNNASARCSVYPCGSGGVALCIDSGGTGKRELRSVGVGNDTDDTATTNVEVWIAQRSSTTASLYVGTAGASQALDLPTLGVTAPGGATTLVGAITTGPVFGWIGDIYEIGVLATELTAAQRSAYLAEVGQNYGAL